MKLLYFFMIIFFLSRTHYQGCRGKNLVYNYNKIIFKTKIGFEFINIIIKNKIIKQSYICTIYFSSNQKYIIGE